MATISLDQFRAIAGGADSIGYVGERDGRGHQAKLVKLAAHRFLSNVPVAATDPTHSFVRTDMYNALKTSLGANPNAAMQDFLRLAAEKLGVRLGQNGEATGAVETPLSRRDVRTVLAAHDLVKTGHLMLKMNENSTPNELLDIYEKVVFARTVLPRNADLKKVCEQLEARFIKDFADFGGAAVLEKVLANHAVKPFEHGAAADEGRKLAFTILCRVMDGVTEGDISRLGTKDLQSLVQAVLDGRIESLDEFRQTAESYLVTDGVNTEEVLDIAARWEEAEAADRAKVTVAGEQVKRAPMTDEQIAATLAKAKAAEPKGLFGSVFAFFADAKADEPKAPEVAPPPPENFACAAQDVQDMLADLIFDGNTLATDKEKETAQAKGLPQRSAHLKQVLQLHAKEMTAVLCNPELVASLPPDVKEAVESLVEGLPVKMIVGRAAEELGPADAALVYAKLTDFLKGGVLLEMGLAGAAAKIDALVNERVETLQKMIEDEFAQMLGKESVSTTIEKMIGGQNGYHGLDEMLEQLKDKKSHGLSVKEVVSPRTHTATWKLTLPSGDTLEVEKGEIADADEYFGEGEARAKKSAAKLREDRAAVAARREAQAAGRVKAGQALLDFLTGAIASDPNRGYGAFMVEVMSNYFRSLSADDKRAMCAAGIRYLQPPKTVPANTMPDQLAEVQEKLDEENAAAKLGALLKGTGPIMQKMLQGMASMDVPDSFKAALEDMRSNLAPIPPNIVKANLLEMIRQNPSVDAINVKKSLGAASVGQAFLCDVRMKDGTTREVVVKMLRPDAEPRCQRERAIFEAAAATVKGGMEVTFKGQLASILEELDLRVEAEHTKAGAVYDRGAKDVKAMKLDPAFTATKYTLVAEKAPGTTVDRLVRDAKAQLATLRDKFRAAQPHGDDNALNASAFVDASRQMVLLHQKLRVHQARLVELTKNWCDEAIYKGGGYYHGDLHAGNIMVDTAFKLGNDGYLARKAGENGAPGPFDLAGNKGLTVIDFGNATQLTPDQRTNVLRMMAAAAARDTNRFMKGFKALMTAAGQTSFEAQRAEIHDMVHNVFSLGQVADSGNRIAVVLGKLQQMGFELPAPIFRFSQCQVRLQGTIDEMNGLLRQIEDDLANVQTPAGRAANGLATSGENPLMGLLNGRAEALGEGGTWAEVASKIQLAVESLDEPGTRPRLKEGLLAFALKPTGGSPERVRQGLASIAANVRSLRNVQPGGPALVALFETFDKAFTPEMREQLTQQIIRKDELRSRAASAETKFNQARKADADIQLYTRALQAYDDLLPHADEVEALLNQAIVQATATVALDDEEDDQGGMQAAINRNFLAGLARSTTIFPSEEVKARYVTLDAEGHAQPGTLLAPAEFATVVDAVKQGNRADFERRLAAAQALSGEGVVARLEGEFAEAARAEEENLQLFAASEAQLKQLAQPFLDAYCDVQAVAVQHLARQIEPVTANLNLAARDTFCDALATVIDRHRTSSLLDLGLVTAAEYLLLGKLNA